MGDHFTGDDEAVVELDATASDLGGGDGIPSHRGDVRALHLIAGVCERVRGASVGGEQQDAFGHEIETTDVHESWDVVHEIEHGGALLRILSRGHHRGGLVQHDPRMRRHAGDHGGSVEHDHVAERIDDLSDGGDRAVHLHSPVRHRLIGSSARHHAGAGEGPLHTHGAFAIGLDGATGLRRRRLRRALWLGTALRGTGRAPSARGAGRSRRAPLRLGRFGLFARGGIA